MVVYLVRRHRLEAEHYQRPNRPVFRDDYEIVLATEDEQKANKMKFSCEQKRRLSVQREPFSYSIGKIFL